ADASPALVRSEMSSRSNSASAAKIPNTNLPEAVVVSMAAPLAGEHLGSHATFGQVMNNVDQMPQIPAEAVQFPHDQRVARPQSFQTRRQLWPIFLRPARLIFLDLLRIHTVSQKRLALSVSGLGPVCF